MSTSPSKPSHAATQRGRRSGRAALRLARRVLLRRRDPVAAMTHAAAAIGTVLLLAGLVSLPGPFSATHAFVLAGVLLCLAALHFALRAHRPAERLPVRDGRAPLDRRLEQLKDLQWEISENEQRYRDLLDRQDDLILRRRTDGTLTFANRAFCRAFEMEPGDILGRCFAPKVLARERIASEATASRGARHTFLELVETSQGARWIAWEEQVVPSTLDGTEEVQCIGRDVTEQRRAREELEDACLRAEAANRAKSRFLAAMSHEIRTPMNGILGMASLLEETCDTPEALTYVRAIDQSARNLLVVIDEILDYSKIEAGKLVLSEAPFALAQVIQSVVELMAPRAHEKKLEIAWLAEPGAQVSVLGDEARIRQILLNLVSNAVKFTDEGGVLIMARATTSVASPEIVQLSLVVQDTGIGLTEACRERLFAEFEQADAAIRRQSGGTGLGLAISRRLARAMGGDIRVQSTPGHGATFTVELPLLRDAGAPEAGEVPDAGQAMSVLLAFDQKLERRALSNFLATRSIPAVETAFDDAARRVESAANAGAPFNRVVVEAGADPDAAAALLASAREAMARCGRSQTEVRGVVLVSVLTRPSLAAFRERGFTAYLVRPVRPASMLEQLGVVSRGPSTPRTLPVLRSSSPPSARKPRVLLVEDNDINELLARRILQKCGCDVIAVRNGFDAVETMRQAFDNDIAPFALVLMDIMMPGMDGVEATQAMRALAGLPPGHRLPPIVALTANAFSEDRRRYLEAGMDDYLAKPFDKRAVEGLLARWVPADGRAA